MNLYLFLIVAKLSPLSLEIFFLRRKFLGNFFSSENSRIFLALFSYNFTLKIFLNLNHQNSQDNLNSWSDYFPSLERRLNKGSWGIKKGPLIEKNFFTWKNIMSVIMINQKDFLMFPKILQRNLRESLEVEHSFQRKANLSWTILSECLR